MQFGVPALGIIRIFILDVFGDDEFECSRGSWFMSMGTVTC